MNDDFSIALKYALRFEGGYSNDPKDPGGPTNKGVTQKKFDEWLLGKGFPPRSVASITEQEIVQIYHEEFWMKFKCGYLPTPLSIAVFDFCVNAGGNGAKRLQRVLGMKGNAIDGIIGNATLKAVRDFANSDARTLDLVKAYQRGRKAYYYNIVTKKPSLVRFIKGWLRRVDELSELIGIV